MAKLVAARFGGLKAKGLAFTAVVLLATACLSTFFPVCGVARQSAPGGAAVLAELESLEANAIALSKEGSPLIEMPRSVYKRLFLSEGKLEGFQVAVLFSVPKDFAKKVKCEECLHYGEAFRQAANLFHHTAPPSPSLRLFTVFMDVSQDRELAAVHGFQSVPVVVFFGTTRRVREGNFLKIAPIDTLAPTSQWANQMDMTRMVTWLNARSGYSVIPVKSLKERLSFFCTLLIVLVTLLAVGVRFVLMLGRRPWLLVVPTLFVQWIGTSGIFYSIQNAAPWFGFDMRTGLRLWIARGPRAQYCLEGFGMAAVNIIGALGFVAMLFLPTSNWAKLHRKSSNILILLCGSLFVACAALTFSVYRFKSGWMTPMFFPPKEYVRGPVRNDRGNLY
eukprot:GHVT01040913.1.p1 GENE.GHVT01040913.1~~GHVT01040913.1.p1  ORF type:complete len:391 (+),score=66.22 GHVT01040913.1:283-1455(+)